MDRETLRKRREDRRREIRRRRALAGLALVLAVAAVALAVAAGSGSGGGSSPTDLGEHAEVERHGQGRRERRSPAGTAGALAKGSAPSPQTEVPVLMYHVIAAPPAGAPFPGLYVAPEEFEQQMLALKSAGWHAVTLDQVRAHWLNGASLGPGKPIVLSFDNGYQSQYTQRTADPEGTRMGGGREHPAHRPTAIPGRPRAGRIHGLVSAGWELDTQGFSHADLITLDPEQLRYQVEVARHVVQQRYHVPVNWFCYPSGHYNEAVVAEVHAAGYVGSTTVVPGWARGTEDPYRLHRLRVLGGTSGTQLLQLIAATEAEPPAPASYNGT